MELLFMNEYLLKGVSSFKNSLPFNLLYSLSGYFFFSAWVIDSASGGIWFINSGLLLLITNKIIAITTISITIPIIA